MKKQIRKLMTATFALVMVGLLAGSALATGLSEAKVLDTKPNKYEIKIKMGTKQGLRVGDQYEIIDVREGALAGQFDIVGLGRIARVGENAAWVEVSRRHTDALPRTGEQLNLRFVDANRQYSWGTRRVFIAPTLGRAKATSTEVEYDPGYYSDYMSSSGKYSETDMDWCLGMSIGYGEAWAETYGTVTMVRTHSTGHYIDPDPDGYDDPYMDDMSYSSNDWRFYYSGSMRVFLMPHATTRPYVKFGFTMPLNDITDQTTFGYHLGGGLNLELADHFSVSVELERQFGDGNSRFNFSLIPELALIRF